MGEVILAVGSYTRARRAQGLLARHGIKSGLRRLPASERGCGYGLALGRETAPKAKALLAGAGLLRNGQGETA